MEPPAKRPRLAIFQSDEHDAELEMSRRQNDMLLKSRFEAIFQKYGQDFTGTGDEVDLQTGRIIVDNGHLASISDERDTGMSMSPAPEKTVANGRSMLRAMTAAPDRQDPYFDNNRASDVIESIEAIAENAAASEDEDGQEDDQEDDGGGEESEDTQEDGNESEDDLFARPAQEVWRNFSLRPDSNENSSFMSDQDSLFDVAESRRDATPDSLFEEVTPSIDDARNKGPAATVHESFNRPRPILDENSDEQAIRARFGDVIGQEVIELLQKRDNAELHINPAWRIPIQLQRESVPSESTPDADVDYSDLDQSDEEMQDTGRSLWAPTVIRPARRSARQKITRRLREESEDPLQDGFNSDEDGVNDCAETAEADEAKLDRFDRLLNRGMCPFCKLQCVNRTTALSHLSRLAKKFKEGRQPDGFHDLNGIETLRSYVMRQSKENRGPRLFVCDFRTMVELHEGAGLSFADIRSSGTLKTQGKDAMSLRNHYLQWRRVESELDEVKSREGWTRKDDRLLLKLAGEPMTTMVTIHRHFEHLKDTDIGNRLAALFMDQLQGMDDQQTVAGREVGNEIPESEGNDLSFLSEDMTSNQQLSNQHAPYASFGESDFHGEYYCQELPFVESVKDEAGGPDDPLFVPRIW